MLPQQSSAAAAAAAEQQQQHQQQQQQHQQQQQPYLSVIQIFSDKHAEHLGKILQRTVTRPIKKQNK